MAAYSEHAAEAPLEELLARALVTTDGRAPVAAVVDALHLRLATPDGVREAVEAYLANADPTALAAVRLLRLDIARGVSEGGLVLARCLSRRFDSDERLAELRLRFLFGLDRGEALVADIESLLDRGVVTAPLAYQMFLCLNRTIRDSRSDLFDRAVLRLTEIAAEEGAGEAELWLGRFHREMENVTVALRMFMSAWNALPATNAFRPVALREAADLAIRADRWGRDATTLLTAWREGARTTHPWRSDVVAKVFEDIAADACLDGDARLPGTDVYSHLYATVGTPEAAFDRLLDGVLPGRVPYEPADTLLMVGTSLAGGGMERIFANTYRAVAESGAFSRVRMALLTFEPDGPRSFYLPQSGAAASEVEVLAFDGVPDYPVSLLPLGLARRVWRAHEIIVRERPRVIHAWNDVPGIVAAFAGLLAGCPRIIIHFHHLRAINLTNDRSIMRSFPACYRRLLERPEIDLLFVSDASADDYADWWSVRRTSKFRRLLNGFSMADEALPSGEASRAALGFPPDALIVGTVFRFHAVKRPRLWIETARLIHAAAPATRFLMVGDGALWEEAKALVAALGLQAAFHFPGQVRNVADYLACFDLFMLTSDVEGLPNSLVEAQIAGVPVISTDAGGARETFLPGRTGRLVKEATPRALADAALACLGDPDWLAAARSLSTTESRATFGIRAYLERLLALYGVARNDGADR